ncbi:MAG: hypothetical protein QF793_01920 [Candidatus Peribacteraceae bacterium]|jgi:hypothetical protein|nr:hypothetical protein [bacterium]MDP6561660.1 hypothetical protein [Candidatus Peribacteraceae bacterium]|tara:strand:+ start:2496 stop:3083 length:588 start_codon:yes stop_codon:yes gene_type:complete
MNSLVASVRAFAHQHDDLPAFHAAFLILAFITAGLFNLGAFGLLIVAHMSLDIVKYRERHQYSWKDTFDGVVRESLVDVTLLSVGLVFSVYLHHGVGVASVAGLMRAELSVLRMLALLVPKLKILHHFLKVVAHLHHYLEQVHPRHRKGWSGLDHLCFYFLGLSVFLLIFAAPLMHVEWSLVGEILAEELIPWRL